MAGEPTGVSVNTCTGCKNLLRYGTCGEPMAAGLLTAKEEFAIVWPPEGHGAACPAYIGKMPTAATDRPHRLTNDEAGRCHSPCWNDAETAALTARTKRFALLGRADVDDLAEPLTLRELMEPVPDVLMRCTSFRPALRALRINPGAKDANHDD